MNVVRVMTIDAGQSTGVAIIDYPADKPMQVVHVDQFKAGLEDTVRELVGLQKTYDPIVVAIEQFDLRPGNKFLADLTTVEVNAVLKYVWGYDAIVWQTPAQAKGQVNDLILKRLGLWLTGKDVGEKDADDVRDALRHNIYYAVNSLGHLPTIAEGWPRPAEEEED